MKPVPFKWTLRAKQMNSDGINFLYKVRCVLRGDKNEEYIDFDPKNIYAPIATHESIRALISSSTNKDLLLEEEDVTNAYLYGKLDIPIFMEQPTK